MSMQNTAYPESSPAGTAGPEILNAQFTPSGQALNKALLAMHPEPSNDGGYNENITSLNNVNGNTTNLPQAPPYDDDYLNAWVHENINLTPH